MTREGRSHETSGRDRIAMLAEEELDRVAGIVDGAIQIHPSAADPHIGFVERPLAGYCPLSLDEALEQKG